jgi:hypothetical protein
MEGRRHADLMQMEVGEGSYFVVTFMDEYSQYIVHHQISIRIGGVVLNLAAQPVIETLPCRADGLLLERRESQSDNRSACIARESLRLLSEPALGHHRIKPHGPEKIEVTERSFWIMRRALEGEELSNLQGGQSGPRSAGALSQRGLIR